MSEDPHEAIAREQGIEPDYQRVGRYVTQRRAALPEVTLTELVKRSGVSGKTWKRLSDGEPVVQPAKLAAMSRALGWTADSLAAIRFGEEPMSASATLKGVDPEVFTLLARLAEALEEVSERVAELERQAGISGSASDGEAPSE